MNFANLTGHTALITGGSRGIGRATAELLQKLGATVIIHGSTAETVEKTASELGVQGIVANLFEEGSVEKIATQAGQVHHLAPSGGQKSKISISGRSFR